MPVNSTHPDYDANIVAWQRARDVFAGEDAVKAAAEKYLPRLDCQDDKEYLAYKNRASFFNASARTADGFVGLIFRRDPTFKLPDDRQASSASDGISNRAILMNFAVRHHVDLERGEPSAGANHFELAGVRLN